MTSGKRGKPPAGVKKGHGRNGFGKHAADGAGDNSNNPFEKLWNRRKFNILGKKQKGSNTNVSISRSRANDKRKSTLLEEFKRRGKKSAFLDRRFGEGAGDDPGLTQDTKAIMRFQRERQIQMSKKSRYALTGAEGEDVGDGGEEEEQLTHMGRALSSIDDFPEGPDWAGAGSDDDDEDSGRLEEQFVREFNFGGGAEEFGGQRRGDGDDEAGEQRPKTKKEVMQEIIAKSKMYKALRARQKEEGEEMTNKLDDEFRALASAGKLATGNKGEGRPAEAAPEGKRPAGPLASAAVSKGCPAQAAPAVKVPIDDFDALTRSLMFEARGHATDRLKRPEEIAKENRDRLEALESKRLKRMRGQLSDDEGSGDSDDDGDGRKKMTYSERRRRQLKAARKERAGGESGDALGDDFGLEEPQPARGKGVDDVVDDDNDGDDDDDDGDDGDEGEDDDDGEEGASSSEEEEGGSEDEGEEEESDGEEGSDLDDEEAPSDLGQDDGLDQADDSDMSSDEGDEEGKKGASKKAEGKKEGGATGAKGKGKGEKSAEDKAAEAARRKEVAAAARKELPYTFAAPQQLGQLLAHVTGRSVAELDLVLQRIRACNAITLAGENRKKMQMFYGVLLQYFAAVAGEAPLELDRLQVISRHLAAMSAETPLFAAVCARERLKRMRLALRQRLSSLEGGCWPTARQLLLLKLWARIFPVTDARHPVLTPATLLLGQCLSDCPLLCGRDVAAALFVCSLLLHMTGPAGRLCPEPLVFLTALLQTCVPTSAPAPSNKEADGALKGTAGAKKKGGKKGRDAPAISSGDAVRPPVEQGGAEGKPAQATLAASLANVPSHQRRLLGDRAWLALDPPAAASTRAEADGGGAPQPLPFAKLLAAEPDDAVFSGQAFRRGALAVALQSASGFVSALSQLPALPELLQPLRAAVAALPNPRTLGPELEALRAGLLAAIDKESVAVLRERKHLTLREKRPVPIKQFNPRFEEEYAEGRDYDVDKERAEMKKLKKQVKKEEKGAARELRKDNYFLAAERLKERAIVEQEKDEKYKEAMSFLQQQEHAFKSGQLGKGKRRRK